MEISNSPKTYHTNGSYVYSCVYHVIFCPKYRRHILSDKIQTRLKEIVYANEDTWQYKVIEIETMDDHVHLLLDVDPKIGIYKTVGRIKGITSNILRKEYPELKRKMSTLWSSSKFISSVGSVTLEVVKKYIEDQKNS